MKKSIQLSHLINDCIIMAQHTGKIVRQAHFPQPALTASRPQSTVQKEEKKSQIASADFLIRQTYLHNLSQLYPGISLICQGEKPTSKKHFAQQAFIQPEALLELRKTPNLPYHLLSQTAQSRYASTELYKEQLQQVFEQDAASIDISAGTFQNEYAMSDIAVWIDPIDGSKAFGQGDINNVTNLIGITVKGRPKVGIMHKPFQSDKPSQTRTYVGCVEAGLFYFDHSASTFATSSPTYVPPFEQKANPELAAGHYQPHVIMGTDHRQTAMMKEVMSDLQPMKVNTVKGPGNKFLHLAKERSDFFLNLVPGYEMWDICASEAIFASRGGILSDAKQKPLLYDSLSRRSFSLWNGLVAARNSDIYVAMKNQYENRSGKTLAASQTEIRRDIHLQKVEQERKLRHQSKQHQQ